MRSQFVDFTLIRKKTLDETLQLMNQEPGVWRPFAGGTDLMVQFEMGKLSHRKFLDISNFDEIQKIQNLGHQVSIGALTTYSDLQGSEVIQKYFPMLVRSSFLTGAIAIQNRGTLGGNIANASPAADALPVLLAYGARLLLRSQRGDREIPYLQFHQGYKKMDLAADEIIAAVILPYGVEGSPSSSGTHSRTHHLYKKVGTRAFQSISKVAIAATASIQSGVIHSLKFAYASVAAQPILLQALEREYRGKTLGDISQARVVEILRQEIFPLDDIRSSSEYRFKVLSNLTWDFVQKMKLHPQNLIHLES